MSSRGEASSAQSSAAALSERESRAALHREPTRAAPASARSGPLTPAELAQLERAALRLRALRRGVLLARLHAVGFALCAAISVPAALLSGSVPLLALALLALAAGEWFGASALKAFDPRGPRWLAAQQWFVLLAIVVYCVLGIRGGLAQGSLSEQLTAASPELAAMLAETGAAGGAAEMHGLVAAFDSAYRAGVVAFYVALLAAGALYQVACALFHARRGRLLRAHLQDTPRWVADVLGRLSW